MTSFIVTTLKMFMSCIALSLLCTDSKNTVAHSFASARGGVPGKKAVRPLLPAFFAHSESNQAESRPHIEHTTPECRPNRSARTNTEDFAVTVRSSRPIFLAIANASEFWPRTQWRHVSPRLAPPGYRDTIAVNNLTNDLRRRRRITNRLPRLKPVLCQSRKSEVRT